MGERFNTYAPELDVVIWPDDGTTPEQVDYALAWLPPVGVLAGFPNLKAVFSLGAGVDHILSEPKLPDVPLVRVVDPNLTMRMSEYVCLHVLMHHRQQRHLDVAQKAGVWSDRPQWAASAMRVGVMGMGELGRDAAEKLVHLGFQVNGWSNSRKQVDGVTSFAGQASSMPSWPRPTFSCACCRTHRQPRVFSTGICSASWLAMGRWVHR
jgi:glyoxylate/hydroxypyruvate reductase A